MFWKYLRVTLCRIHIIVVFGLPVLKANSQAGDLTLQPLTDQLYAVIGGGGNSVFLITEEGVLVIDSKNTVDAAKMTLVKIREITDKPIRYLIFTHYHGDHVFGAAGMAEGASVVAHSNVKVSIGEIYIPYLKENITTTVPQQIDALKKKIEVARREKASDLQELEKNLEDTQNNLANLKEVELIYPDITFQERLTIHTGAKTIELIYLGPGHTNGDILVHFPEEKAIHIGDVLFHTGTCPYLDNKTGASAGNLLNILTEIESFDVQLIIPGHGDIMDMSGFKKDSERTKAYLTALHNEVKKVLKQGASLDEVKEKVKMEGFSDMAYFDYFLLRNIEAEFEAQMKDIRNH